MDAKDTVEIMQLVALYGHAADSPEEDLYSQVFTEDAVVDCTPIGGDIIEGREAIAAWFGLGKPPHPPSHHSTNTVVREVSGEVRVQSKWFVINPIDGTGSTGDYKDVVVRARAGWRIERRTISVRGPRALDFSQPRAAQLTD